MWGAMMGTVQAIDTSSKDWNKSMPAGPRLPRSAGRAGEGYVNGQPEGEDLDPSSMVAGGEAAPALGAFGTSAGAVGLSSIGVAEPTVESGASAPAEPAP